MSFSLREFLALFAIAAFGLSTLIVNNQFLGGFLLFGGWTAFVVVAITGCVSGGVNRAFAVGFVIAFATYHYAFGQMTPLGAQYWSPRPSLQHVVPTPTQLVLQSLFALLHSDYAQSIKESVAKYGGA